MTNHISTSLITHKDPTWLDEISYNQDVRVQWEWLKYSVRKKIVQYKVKAKQRSERINSIENKLKVAEEKQSETQIQVRGGEATSHTFS